jgi:hypothetical protein
MDSRHCVDDALVSRSLHSRDDASRHLADGKGARSVGVEGRAASKAKGKGCVEHTHYDTHNLYGLAEARVTALAMQRIKGTRPFVISRSTFPGSGAWGGHWLGDNEATWEDMRASISGMLTMGISGVPLVGADVCGFSGNASRELCIRWTGLGALYPFARNHNSLDTRAQEPSSWDEEAQAMMRFSLQRRYRLLPYLYTLFYSAHVSGTPVARSLLAEFAHLVRRPPKASTMPAPDTRKAVGASGGMEHWPTGDRNSLGEGESEERSGGGGWGWRRRRRLLQALSTDTQFMLGETGKGGAVVKMPLRMWI